MADQEQVEQEPSKITDNGPHGTGFGSTMVDPSPGKFGPDALKGNAPKNGDLIEQPTPNADFDKLKADFEALKAENVKLNEVSAKATTDAQQSQAYVRQIVERMQQAAVEPAGDIRDRMNEDPNRTLDEHFNARIAPLAKMTLENNAQTNFQIFENQMKDDEDWKMYRPEVEKFMESIPLEVKAQPKSWEKAYDLVRINHLNEIVERKSAKQSKMEKAAFVEAPSGARPTASRKQELSDIQKQIAKGLDLTEDEYREYMK